MGDAMPVGQEEVRRSGKPIQGGQDLRLFHLIPYTEFQRLPRHAGRTRLLLQQRFHAFFGCLRLAAAQLDGRGDQRPVESNDKIEGRARNRRVTLNILADSRDEISVLPLGN